MDRQTYRHREAKAYTDKDADRFRTEKHEQTMGVKEKYTATAMRRAKRIHRQK